MTVRETGYITTARDALGRIVKAGITADLAQEAAHALAPEVVASFARVEAARVLAGKLGPTGSSRRGRARSGTKRYDGTWLDTSALASAIRMKSAAAAVQALHLAAVLAEVDGGTPVHLATANAMRSRRPGERTHRRVLLEGASTLPALFRKMAPSVRSEARDAALEELARETLLGRVRERASADARPELRAHLARLENALAGEVPPLGPLADTEISRCHRTKAGGRRRRGHRRAARAASRAGCGRTAGIRYLRARAALVRGDEPPRNVAQTLSAIVGEEQNFHEAEPLRRACLAGGGRRCACALLRPSPCR